MRRSALISDRAWRILTKRDTERFDFLRSLPYGRTLDIGCGQGYLTVLLALDGVDITGCDIDEVRLAAARDLARINGARVRFERADARRMTHEPYDTVLCAETLEHIHEWQDVLHECMRLTRNDLYITVPAKGYLTRNKAHVNDFTPEDITALLDGFETQVRVEPPFTYIIARRERHGDGIQR